VKDKFITILGTMTLGLLMVAFIAVLIGYPVKWLWNTTLPGLVSVPTIGFWQAFRLSILCGLLVKSSVSTKS
jgi:hypothetical protein